MGKFDIEQYEDEQYDGQRPVKPKITKAPKREMAGKGAKRRDHKRLDKRLDEESSNNAQGVADLFAKISSGATLEFQDKTKINQYQVKTPDTGKQRAIEPAPEAPTVEEPAAKAGIQKRKSGIIRIEHALKTSEEQISDIIAGRAVHNEELCRILGLRFVTDSKDVLRLFQDPVNVPMGSTYRIVDQYFETGCDCTLVKTIKVNGIKFLFKRNDTGGFTSYTPISLKDAKSVEYIGLRKVTEVQ